MITVKLVGKQKVIASLTKMPASVQAMLYQKSLTLAIYLQNYIRSQKLSGQVLNVRTGDLRRSIQQVVTQSAKRVLARVFSAGDVKYAGIHEFGGRTGPHMIYPRKGDVLAFMAGGKMRFARYVNHPGSRMPERSFMRSSFSENQQKIISELKLAVLQGIKDATR